MAAILISNVKRGIRVYSSEGREENHPLSFSRFDTHLQTRLGTFKTQMAACKDRCEQSSEGGYLPKQKEEKSNSPSSWKKLKGQSYSCSKIEEYTAVILLQMIMVSPVTHFVKNHESQSMSQWFPVKKIKNSTKRKWLGFYVIRQLVWRQTPKLWITVYGN